MERKYREININEIGFLKEMLYLALYVPEGQEKYPVSIVEKPEIKKYVKDWGKTSLDIAFVAVEKKELAGAIWGRAFQQPDVGYGFIDKYTPEISIAVKKEFRNKGIGTQLIQIISDHYKNRGIEAISLSVDKPNKAHELYVRTGFKTVSSNKTDYIMRKKLIDEALEAIK
ncbi:MAG: GNAT family N-acetyltransferase [Spirochaetes bacterium]|nr:GNAT family N-acetyltransferase [Spirochaetota bacterium]